MHALDDEPASIIAAIELAMVARWTEGAAAGRSAKSLPRRPVRPRVLSDLDEGDRGERASAHLSQAVARLMSKPLTRPRIERLQGALNPGFLCLERSISPCVCRPRTQLTQKDTTWMTLVPSPC